MNKRTRTPPSPETRAKLKLSKAARDDALTTKRHESIRAVLQTIQDEISQNSGVYPHNEGKLDFADVARRAGMHPNTFYKPRYDTVYNEVDAFIKAYETPSPDNPPNNRRTLAERYDALKAAHNDVLEHYRLAEVDREYAEARVTELEEENATLRLSLAEMPLKVVPLRSNNQG